MRIKIQPKTKAQLMRLANPEMANQPEVLPWVLYDTQTFVSGTTQSLNFFSTLQTNKSLGNMESAGQIPDPQFFEVHYFGCDIMVTPTTIASGVVGAIDDIHKLLWGDAGDGSDAGRFTFVISNKRIGPFPLSYCHGSGGAIGFGWSNDNVAAGGTPESIQYANNGVFDGGYYAGGSIIIPPKIGFNVDLDWGGPITLSGNVAIRFNLMGVLHRRVL